MRHKKNRQTRRGQGTTASETDQAQAEQDPTAQENLSEEMLDQPEQPETFVAVTDESIATSPEGEASSEDEAALDEVEANAPEPDSDPTLDHADQLGPCELEPALSITTLMGRRFWVCGQPADPGKAVILRASELSEAMLDEIRLKRDAARIAVEEIEA